MLLFSLICILILLVGIFLAIRCVKIFNEKKQEKNFRKKVLKIKKECLKHPKSEESVYLFKWIDYYAKKGFSKSDVDIFTLKEPCFINYSPFILYTLIKKYNYEDIIKRMDIIREICHGDIKPKDMFIFFRVQSKRIMCVSPFGYKWHHLSSNIFEMCDTRLKEKNK